MLTNDDSKAIFWASGLLFLAGILSPPKRTYHMGDKFQAYLILPSPQLYLFIEPE
jgi:hypothetical protein